MSGYTKPEERRVIFQKIASDFQRVANVQHCLQSPPVRWENSVEFLRCHQDEYTPILTLLETMSCL